MKGFLLKISIWLALAVGCHLVAAYFADGHTDAYYLKFTGEPRPGLVLGTSRAAQGIDPGVMHTLLVEHLRDPDLLNYSFTIGHSPYGPTYLSSIKKKLDRNAHHGLFVLSVDPWSLSIAKSHFISRDDPFPEDEHTLGRQWSVNSTPNVEYLVKNYTYGWGRMIVGRWYPFDSYVTLHNSGWLEVNVPMDSAIVVQRRLEKVALYNMMAEVTETPSERRIEYLEKTIDLLMQHGTVVLLRMPTHQDILRIEQNYWPGFHAMLVQMAERKQVRFIDHTPLCNNFVYTDGNHLAASSVPDYSRRLAAEIGALLNTGTQP